ncbi:DeoR/GlpR family DNA-binding transcription regulator [uncultured Microbacterium sp.]|uniref:DeoR/GlpR family DNA-binding transcription regulator n=1 Tax=uncultured Microbacterium sp. TaxID=191216 RepID=UPI0026171E9E|nr:DeoR/GlpR family DNA-binding transcription regulator [uncultured Microbacterium sp.]
MAQSSTPRIRRDLKGDARRARIVDLLQERAGEDLGVDELSTVLGVSAATVRRDLGRMRELGVIARTYGGGTLIPQREVPVRDRFSSHQAAKDAIGRLAAGFVTKDELIVVDAGSTTARFAAHLGGRDDVTVITNGIGVINSLLDAPGPEVIVLGGRLRGINETIVGDTAHEMLSRIRASHAFIGVDSIDPQRGIASQTLAQSLLKSRMIACAEDVVILADSSKLESDDFRYWSPMQRPWRLVTDSGIDERMKDRARLAGATDILVAPLP